MVFQLSDKLFFPTPSLADESGLLAVGGDLSESRLVLAYREGIFPWYSEGDPILWYSPHRRFVLFPSELHISRSLQRLVNTGKYEIKWNSAFEEVIGNCAIVPRKGQPGTWIHEEMIEAYTRLHKNNIAQSIEVWQDGNLTGGIYGVVLGKVFCGESMFNVVPNASKLALVALCQSGKFDLIDCQVHTPHLERMGARFIERKEFMKALTAL